MSFDLTNINWLGVAVAALATFMLGGLWYTALFGKTWQQAHGYDEATIRQLQTRRPPPVFFGLMIVCYFIVALGIALLIQAADAQTLQHGAALGFAVWLVVAAITLTNHLPTHVAWPGFLVDLAYSLIYCIGIGALLGAWR